jgi:HAMP domain-containing protein
MITVACIYIIAVNLWFWHFVTDPIDALTRVARRIAEGSYGTRIEPGPDDEIGRLSEELNLMSEKVAIAAQLDATGITMTPLNKRNKAAKKMKDCKQIQVSFTIAKNVTASNGNRTLYVRIQTPNGDVLNGGVFDYENRQIEYSMRKTIEYGGEETAVTTYWNVNEFLGAGEYRVSIFADGNMIGSRTFTFN